MVVALPRIQWKQRIFVVDFRLQELRAAQRPFETVRFADLTDGRLKERLRTLRFRAWFQEYMPGLDD